MFRKCAGMLSHSGRYADALKCHDFSVLYRGGGRQARQLSECPVEMRHILKTRLETNFRYAIYALQ